MRLVGLQNHSWPFHFSQLLSAAPAHFSHCRPFSPPSSQPSTQDSPSHCCSLQAAIAGGKDAEGWPPPSLSVVGCALCACCCTGSPSTSPLQACCSWQRLEWGRASRRPSCSAQQCNGRGEALLFSECCCQSRIHRALRQTCSRSLPPSEWQIEQHRSRAGPTPAAAACSTSSRPSPLLLQLHSCSGGNAGPAGPGKGGDDCPSEEAHG